MVKWGSRITIGKYTYALEYDRWQSGVPGLALVNIHVHRYMSTWDSRATFAKNYIQNNMYLCVLKTTITGKVTPFIIPMNQCLFH